jgi:hypothetical protein
MYSNLADYENFNYDPSKEKMFYTFFCHSLAKTFLWNIFKKDSKLLYFIINKKLWKFIQKFYCSGNSSRGKNVKAAVFSCKDKCPCEL